MNEHDTHRELKMYTAVYVGLLCLTAATVSASWLHVSRYAAVSVALAMASVKAALIGWYFMHLKSERPLVWTVIGVGLLTVIILVVGVFPDLALRLR